MSPLKNIIIQKESDENVRQWHLNREQSIALISVTAILIGLFVFLGADYLSTYIYEKRLNEFKANYSNVSKNLEILKERLAQIDEDLEINNQSIVDYFSLGYIQTPRTIYKNIHQLSPAHWLKFSVDKLSKILLSR